jgi:hypothetical protein
MTPGGGGYGDPLARDVAAVVRDVRLGYYTAEETRALFGVALLPGGDVDAAETERLRQAVGCNERAEASALHRSDRRADDERGSAQCG